MRRAIRLTGRRQLSRSGFDFRMNDLGDRRIASLVIQPGAGLNSFPPAAEVRVRLAEHGLVKVLKFGTVGRAGVTADLEQSRFVSPSCQVRIVLAGGAEDGKLLGSTKTWSYTEGGQAEGLLDFQAGPTAPSLWRLDIREDESRPLLYVDERIENAGIWAKTNPVFIAGVFPHVIERVMQAILETGSMPDDGWMADWMTWVQMLMPGTKPPFGETSADRTRWISELNDAFAARHDLAGEVIRELEAKR